MAAESQQKRRRVVVAPPAAILTLVVTLVLAGVGARLVATASSPVGMSIGIAVLWVGVNVLIVGLVSSSAWRRRAIVVGGERVEPGTVAEPRAASGRRHGVLLRAPGASGARTLHGFTTLGGPAAELLAARLNSLIGAREPVAERPDPDSWLRSGAEPEPEPEPVVAPEPGAARASVTEDDPAAADRAEGADETATVLLRRGLPLVAAGAGDDDRRSDDAPGDAGLGARASDDTVVLPRRGRVE